MLNFLVVTVKKKKKSQKKQVKFIFGKINFNNTLFNPVYPNYYHFTV